MRKHTARLICAGLLALAAGHLSGCTEGFLDGIEQATTDPAPTSRAVDTPKARQQLAGLTVAPEGPGTGYSRDHFPHWAGVDGPCNTREWVLGKQGQDVRTSPGCYPTSGTWTSPYDGGVWHIAGDVDLDHTVPLAEAWRSGAAGWTEQRREAFANDLGPDRDGYPQLVVVTDNVNQSKGDQDPVWWKPPLTAYWCAYAADWVAVKHTYDLTADRAEVDALHDMLGTCGAGGAR